MRPGGRPGLQNQWQVARQAAVSSTLIRPRIDEAAEYARAHLNDWRRTPGALAWLKEVAG